MNKHLFKAFDILTWIVLVLVILFAVIMVGARPFGYTPYVVMSGSMAPAYPPGSLIYVKKTDPLAVQVGDPITFVLNEDLVVATHRVIQINLADETFTTQGDANDTADAPVHFKNLLGVPKFKIPLAGYAVHAISTSPGKYFALGGVALFIAIMFIFDVVNPEKKKKDKKASKEWEADDDME